MSSCRLQVIQAYSKLFMQTASYSGRQQENKQESETTALLFCYSWRYYLRYRDLQWRWGMIWAIGGTSTAFTIAQNIKNNQRKTRLSKSAMIHIPFYRDISVFYVFLFTVEQCLFYESRCKCFENKSLYILVIFFVKWIKDGNICNIPSIGMVISFITHLFQ